MDVTIKVAMERMVEGAAVLLNPAPRPAFGITEAVVTVLHADLLAHQPGAIAVKLCRSLWRGGILKARRRGSRSHAPGLVRIGRKALWCDVAGY